MATSVPVNGYASVADYELRSGTDVPAELEPTVQTRLNDVSALMDIYMGVCAAVVADAYPDVLCALTVSTVYRDASMPVGVKTESVGGTSVTYDTGSGPLTLDGAYTSILDSLMESVCGPDARHDGVGQIGLAYAGPPERYQHGWPDPTEIDLWVLAGRGRRI